MVVRELTGWWVAGLVEWRVGGLAGLVGRGIGRLAGWQVEASGTLPHAKST